MPLASGTRLGPYEVATQIGVGGMGEVYRATDTNLGRQVAIKVLPESVAQDAERLARFDREARTLAALNHPNIAAIYGLEKSGGMTALVMELVEGPTLADRIAQGAIPVDEALPIAKQIAEALEAAHEQGIIHRDLKPANIKVRPDGTVKVLDFGLAKAMEPTSAMSASASMSPTITTPAMTQAGMILGTAAYMSPEQARGKPVDKRADIWAFGCVLYEMLTGRRAFEDEDISMTLSKVLQREPEFDALPATVPSHVSQALRLCLRKAPRERVPDMGAVRLALDGAFEPVARAGMAVAPYPWRENLRLAAALVIGGLAVGLVAWGLWPTRALTAVNRFSHRLADNQEFGGLGPHVAISADGRYFVYQAQDGLYVRSFGELDGRPIPGTDVSPQRPFISSDGQSVGYWDAGTGQLKRVTMSGGTPAIICAAANPSGVSWAPDNTILFGQAEGIVRVSANGGTPEVVVRAREGESVYGPRLLPDPDLVLFSATTRSGAGRWDEAQLVVQSIQSGERTVVLNGARDARYVETGHLVYAAGTDLFAVPFDVSTLKMTGEAILLVQGVARGNDFADYGVSDEGTLVYVPSAIDSRTLVWVDRQGREEALKAPQRNYIYPRLSPDGTRVSLDILDEQRNIWVWDLSRETLGRLTLETGTHQNAVWTSDGSRIAFSVREGNGMGIHWQPADGSGRRETLTTMQGQSITPKAFSPNGARLLFQQSQPPYDISVLTLDERKVEPLLHDPQFQEHNPELSPDGQWLAYQSDESGRYEVYVRPFPDVNTRRWQVSTNGGTRPLWSRDGKELYYWVIPGTAMTVPITLAPSFQPGMPQVAIQGEYPVTNDGRHYDVSSDGSRFLILKSVGAAAEQIVIVQHLTEELKRLVPTN